jgi:hypothetical protein
MPLASDSTVVNVDLTAFGMPGCIERLAVAHSSGCAFVVACLPFFTYGIQFGDLIAVRKPEMVFDRGIKPRRLRALRLAFNDKKLGGQHHEEIHGRLIGRGLSHEWHGSGY